MKQIAAVILVLVLCLSGCIMQSGIRNQDSALVTIGILDEPNGFFPWIKGYDSNTNEFNANIFDSLVEFDDSFRILPKLAKSWNNPDNCTWRFSLRSDVTFHNGYPFTAYDVKYTLEYIKSNQSHPLRDLLNEVKTVDVIDNYTVDIKTIEPFPILLNKLIDIPIASQRYLEETTEEWPIGTGAYKLKEYVPLDHITLVKYDGYTLGHPVIKEAVFKLYSSSEEMKNALLDKQIDIMEHVPADYIDQISNTSGLVVKQISNPTVWYISFDFRQNSSNYPGTTNPLSDVRVRKALYHAIDVQAIISQSFNSLAEPASQFLSPLIFGYSKNIQRLPYDLNASRTQLKEAGYDRGFNITLLCPEEFPLLVELHETIAQQLSQVANVNIVLVPARQYYRELYARNLSIYIIGWMPGTGDGGEIFDFLLRSENDPLGIGSCNFGHYSNQTVDTISREITHTMNQKERARLMQEGFKIAMDDVACIPLYISVCTIGMSDRLIWSPRSDLVVLVEEIMVK